MQSDRASGHEAIGLDRFFPDLPAREHVELGGQAINLAAGGNAFLINVLLNRLPAFWLMGVAVVSTLPWGTAWSLTVNGRRLLALVDVPISATLADLRRLDAKISPGPYTVQVQAVNNAAVAITVQARVSGYFVGPATGR